jgi:hypothetical protein
MHRIPPILLDFTKYKQEVENFTNFGMQLLTSVYGYYLRSGNVNDISPIVFEKVIISSFFHTLTYCQDDEIQMNFLYSAARLYGACYHIELNDKEYVRAMAGSILGSHIYIIPVLIFCTYSASHNHYYVYCVWADYDEFVQRK